MTIPSKILIRSEMSRPSQLPNGRGFFFFSFFFFFCVLNSMAYFVVDLKRVDSAASASKALCE